jgi:prepilin-type N-terminal cleavage/methylation domain-containing protein
MFPPQDMAAIDRPNEGRAFTLIELSVVIAIIAIRIWPSI